MPLKTDYKNDVLDTSKNTKRKYQQTTNSDGTISLDDVTVYSQEGSPLGASDINATNEAVNNINLYVGEDEKLHFVNGDGADSVLPFSNVEFTDDNVFYMTTSTSNRGGVTFNQDFTIPKKGKHFISITTYQDHPLIKTLNSAKNKAGVQFPVLKNSAYVETTEDNQVITFNITCNKSSSNYYYIGVQCSGFTVGKL